MSKIGISALKWHPVLVLVVYGILISGYRRYLGPGLKFIRPNLPAAPEDILVFGFWVPWLLVALWFGVACTLSYRLGVQRKATYWAPMLCGFVLLSILDFYLYGVLERQVIVG
jgi:hypothetical protein